MQVLAIAASNSREGLNRQIIESAARFLESEQGAEVELLDLNDYEMPIFSIERLERDGVPDLARQFYERIGASDAVVVSFAEHNGSYSVAWKNVYDWASRIDMRVYQDKKVAFFSTSPGSRGGASVLDAAAAAAPFFGADLVGTLAIPKFADNFEPGTVTLVDTEMRAAFEATLLALAAG